MLVVTASASAQTAANTTQEARAHFQAGLARAEQGDLTAALAEFEAAYAVRPHFSVLYNIGQARSTLGRPVEAVAAFERYLADGGAQIAPSRRHEVEALLLSNRKRIGSLRVVAEAGSNPRVWVDGVELGRERMTTAIALPVGEHSIVYASRGGDPVSQVVLVTTDSVAEVKLTTPPPREASEAVAQLSIVCTVPGIDVEIAGFQHMQTPLDSPLLVPSGPLTVRFSR
ncbi:MAG TPA: hypothetical protein VNG33_16150, partial [Polyangiaceae bacterium]|nr:hypothetical protein [Polyangiaceae bacterium]